MVAMFICLQRQCSNAYNLLNTFSTAPLAQQFCKNHRGVTLCDAFIALCSCLGHVLCKNHRGVTLCDAFIALCSCLGHVLGCLGKVLRCNVIEALNISVAAVLKTKLVHTHTHA